MLCIYTRLLYVYIYIYYIWHKHTHTHRQAAVRLFIEVFFSILFFQIHSFFFDETPKKKPHLRIHFLQISKCFRHIFNHTMASHSFLHIHYYIFNLNLIFFMFWSVNEWRNPNLSKRKKMDVRFDSWPYWTFVTCSMILSGCHNNVS